MNRTLLVAWREFGSVVFTKGFLLGILLPPLIAVIAGGAIFLLKNTEGPRVQGRVLVIDHTGVAGPLAVERLPRAIAAQREAQKKDATRQIEKAAKAFAPPGQANQISEMTGKRLDEALPQADITAELLPQDANLEELKAELGRAQITARGESAGQRPLIAVATIPASAIQPAADGTFGVFDLYVAPKLDVQIQRSIEAGIGDAIVDGRIATDPRVTAAGLDAKALRALLQRPNIDPVTITSAGERKSIGELAILIPVGFMMLMMISVMTTGQYLMTTVVEEKSSRVMEVLLSAVSPMQLMTGKIIGHMSVGVLIVVIYGGVGIAGLVVAALTQLVTPMTLLLLVAYFIVASVSMAAMMAAIGSAVNELREAQTLMTPVMMLTVMPWMIWFFIQRAPNSTLATSLSFVPVMGPFVMVLRLGGSEPVPTWQHPVALLVGALTCAVVLWGAAKIFRIGVLMYGKPPNFRTLIRWVRMA